jgi:hypothetical protein
MDMATAAKDWKKGNKEKAYELEVPSGNTCLVRRPGPEAFLNSGNIPNSLLGVVMPLLEQAEKDGKSGDADPIPETALVALQKEIIENPAKLKDMFDMIDQIVVSCVIEPVVQPTSRRDEIRANEDLTDDERSTLLEDTLFVDDVDFEDKSFIFDYVVGGTADIERFRSGSQALVAARQAGPKVQGKAKRAPKSR